MRFMIKLGQGQILEMSVIVQFENLASHLLSKMPKIKMYKIILPVLPVGLLGGKNINCRFLETKLGKYLNLQGIK
jgi:hypothetical protein